MDKRDVREVATVQFVAPYRQCEAALNATAMASFVVRKLKDVRSYKFEYLTADSLSTYCSPFVDSQVYRLVSPKEFEYQTRNAAIIYWFGNSCGQFDKAVSRSARNCLLADFTKWDKAAMRGSRRFSKVVMPCKAVAERAMTLVSCLDQPEAVYPGGYRTVTPARHDLLDRKRMAVMLSMCSINRPDNRLAILRHLEELIKDRHNLRITLLMDGHSFREESQCLGLLGQKYSDRILIVNSFSDYEFTNMLAQNDVFVDLNPINGIGYMLSSALNGGLVVCGFSQPLYRDILCDGQYGILMGGAPKKLGFGFDFIAQDWGRTFRFLDEKLFNVGNVLRWIDKRNGGHGLATTLESRTKSFFRMFTYLSSTSVKFGEFAEA